MPLVIEFATFLILSLAIAGLSALAKNSILVVLISCAAAYAWLWWPKNPIKLVASTPKMQILQILLGIGFGGLGSYFWTGETPPWFLGGLFECLAFFFFISGLPDNKAVSKIKV